MIVAETRIPPIPEACLRPCAEAGTVERLPVPGYAPALVYLPHGYRDASARYPVLYLLHGGGGSPAEFLGEGETLPWILDRLIAGGMPPLIVAAPTYYPDGWTRRDPDGSGEAVRAFVPVLRDRVVPLTDRAFRTLADRDHRAVGGFSMGSVASWQVFLDAPELCRAYLPMSGDCWEFGRLGGSVHAEETARLLADRGRGRDFFIHTLTGTEDIAYPNLNAQLEAMAAHPDVFRFGENIRYGLLAGGVHAYADVRRYIRFALPTLFGRG